ncbi:Replication protein A 32 kDa subunit [Trichinella pseudospiralis]|uniref:Replication protein A 32 kDa subunit n=1 Tax=Trichinella pseudospiralis TaxID=6337 RepID=A0A0V0YDN8_TRIPS|nr:Replication protein A 32 kDa subunit [Trichinella pseudospiralis]
MMDQSFDGGVGGFLASQSGDRTEIRKSQREIVPVTCSMINNMSPGEDNLRIGTYEVSQVCIVAVIRDISYGDIYTDITIDDMTSSPITARQWVKLAVICNVKENKSADEMQRKCNSLVKVFGNITTFQKKKILTVFGMMTVTDLNDLTVHMLEVLRAKLSFEKDYLNTDRKELNRPKDAGATPFMSYGTSEMQADSKITYDNGLSGLRAEIYRFLSNNDTIEGCSVNEMKSHFAHVTMSKLRDEIEFLCCEGHIYSTVDEDHFKASDE